MGSGLSEFKSEATDPPLVSGRVARLLQHCAIGAPSSLSRHLTLACSGRAPDIFSKTGFSEALAAEAYRYAVGM